MLKTKRLFSMVLAILMCISMLTGIVLPAAAADESAADPYAKINATTVDGKLYPADNVYFIDNEIDNKNEPAAGEEVTYTYGDGVKWGNGKTYTLKYLVNLFPSFNNPNKGGGPKTLMIDLSAKWAADPANNKGEAVFVFAPGGFESSTGETTLTAAADDPTPEQLFSVVMLGPQAGKSPVNKDISTEEKAEAVQNGRGNKNNEFKFGSTFHFPNHAKTYMDGFMINGAGKLCAGYNYTDMTMVNLYYTTESGKYAYGNQIFQIGADKLNTRFHLKDSYFNIEHPFPDTANSVFFGNDTVIEGCVFAKGALSTAHQYNQTHHMQFKPNTKANMSANFFGAAYAAKPSIAFRNNAVVDWESCHVLRFYPADASYTDYGTDYPVQINITGNKFYDAGQFASESDVIFWQAMSTDAHLKSHTLNVTDNLFSFSKDWNSVKGTSQLKVIDFLTDGEGHALKGKDMTNYTIKGNTFISDYRGTSTHHVRKAVMSIDMSGNLFMDNDGNIMPFRGTATGFGNDYGTCAAVHSDIYASDEMSGGIRELMTVKEIENGVACYNHILLNERSNFAGVAGRVQATLTVLLKRNSDGTPIEYNADTLLKFDNDKVKFEGIYSDKNCTNKVATVNQDNVTGKYAKATYTAGKTKLTVVYHLNTPTTYRIVDPTNAYVTTGYKFNGVTYKPGEKAADGVTADAVKRADGSTGFYEFVNNSHKDANGNKVPSAYDGIPNPSVNYGKTGIEGLNMTTIVVLTPGTHYFGDNKTAGSQGMGKSVCYVGPQFGVSPFDKELAKTGKLANGRSFDPAKEAVIVGRFDPMDGNYSFVYDGLAFTGDTMAIAATNAGSGAGLLQQTHVIKNCVFNNTSGNLMNLNPNGTTGKVDKDILIADCVYDGTGVTNHAQDSMIFARAGKFAMRNFAVINDSAKEQRLVYSGLVNAAYVRLNRLRTYNDFDNIVFYNSNRNVVLATLRDSNTLAANFENYPNGFELNITNCHVEGGTGYFFGAQAGGKETAGIACDTKFIKLTATNNYFYRPSSTSNIIGHYHEGAGTTRNVYSDDSVFADNIIINGSNGMWTNAYGAKLNIDENFYGRVVGGKLVPNYINAGAAGVVKNKYEYYLNPEMTVKNTDLQLADAYEEIKYGEFIGYNQAEIIAVGDKPAVGKFFKASAGTTIEGVYTDESLATPATGNVDDGTYYVLVKHTATGITCVTAAKVSFSDIWTRNGLAPVDEETFVDITTQELYEARANAHLNSGKADLMFVAPDWKTYAYKDAALTQKVADDATLLEDAANNTNVGNNREMKVGTVFYAKMPTTNHVYKLTYGVTAADFYHANLCKAGTIVAFPGLYNFGSSYQSGVGLYHAGDNNGQVTIGIPQASTDFSEILFLGPQAGVSAADTVNGTSNGRSDTDYAKEAVIENRGFYIMNKILGDGDEFIMDGLTLTKGSNFYYFYGNGNFATKYNNNVTFTFNNILMDQHTGIPFKFYGEGSSVGNDITKNLGKLDLVVNINGSYFTKGANQGWLMGQMQTNQIHINRSVIKDTLSTTDQSIFYINPNTAANNPNKVKLSYTCENSYLELPYSYLFGFYVNGQDLNSTNRQGVEILIDNNKMVDCFITHNGNDRGRGSLITSYNYTDAMAEMTDLTITNNTITTNKEITKTTGGAMVNFADKKPLKSVDISDNVFIGYGKYTLNKGLNADVDITDNVFYDLAGNPIAPAVENIGYTDVNLNTEKTAKITDFNIKSGMAQTGKISWAENGTNIYTQANASAKATIEYVENMDLDSIKASVKFNSDNVSVTNVTSDGTIDHGDKITLTATHALTGKSIDYVVLVTKNGLIPGAAANADTALAGRDYYDPSVKGVEYGSFVVRNVEIDGVMTAVQFTVGENIFGDFNEIPVINKQRDIYLLPIAYGGFNFGADAERNVMNYLHGAKEGITGVADTDNDGVPDVKNPARTDKSKETVLTAHISCGYHADVTVDGVTLDPGFYINNSSGNWGASLATNNNKLLNSVTDTVLLQSRGASDQIIGAKGTHRLNVEVGNSYIVCSDESKGGNIITVRSPEHVNLYNNILDTGAKMGVLYYAPVQSYGKTDTYAFRHEVDIVGNRINGSISLTELPTTSKLPIDVNIKGNLFELGKDATPISVAGMYTDANTYLDAANSKFNIEGNTFTAKPGVYTGHYISFGASSNAADLTVVLKDNTFVRGTNFGANYAISNYGKMVFDASDNNVFDGFKYNTGDHNYIAPMIFRNTGYSVVLSKGEATSYVKYNGKTYATNAASDTFGIADLFSDKAVVDADAKTVTEYVVGATTNKYIFNVDEGMNVKATIGNTTYYNAIPLTNGTGTATVQLTKINGEAVGEAYTVTFKVYCDHTACYASITPDEKVDATCNDGYANYTCPVNGDKFTIVLKGDGNHAYDQGVVTIPATCSTEGVKTFTCTTCNVYGEQTAASYTEVIAIQNHTAAADAEWDIILMENCKDDGEEVKYCQWCNVICERQVRKSTGEHNFVPTVKTPATCTTEGVVEYYCAGCKVKHDEAIPVLGHDYKAETTKEPTCIEDGIMTYTCANECGSSYTETIKANGKHVYESAVTTEATCHSEGVMTYTCGNCTDSYTETIPATGKHEYAAAVTTEPTCTEDGVMTYTCTAEGCGNVKTEVIANKGGHVWTPWTLGMKSGCAEGTEGYDVRTCTVCGEQETRERALVDHVYDSEFTIDVQPTGSVAGIKSRHCLVCKDARTEITNIGYCQHEHYTGEKVITRETYCLEPGLIVDICADCGDQCNEQTIPVLPHDLHDVEVLVEGDCTTDRVVAQKCDLCTQIYNRVETAPGHNAGVWKTTVKPTCTNDGTAEQHCTVCDALIGTRVVAATNHACGFEWITVAEATCTREGLMEYTCVDCGHVATTKSIAIKGHQDVHVDTVPATCTEPGYRTYVCLICNAPLEDVEIPATGHKAGKWQTVKPATTNAPGLKVKECTVCGEVVEEQAIEQIINSGACHPFTDVSNKAWYHSAVDFVYGSGLMNGTTATKFAPDVSTSRGMFVTILGRLSGVDASKYTTAYFEDVKDGSYYFGYIEWARVNGIVNGTANYIFAPDRAITRQEMCKIIVSYADFEEIELTKKNAKTTFTDDAKIASWAKTYVYTAQRAGIVSGDAAGTFRPTDTAKRCEIATLIMNFYNAYVK